MSDTDDSDLDDNLGCRYGDLDLVARHSVGHPIGRSPILPLARPGRSKTFEQHFMMWYSWTRKYLLLNERFAWKELLGLWSMSIMTYKEVQ